VHGSFERDNNRGSSMNFLVWLITRACAGSFAAMMMRQNIGHLANVAFGIAGAFVGGLLCVHGNFANGPLAVTTFCVSLIGAIAVPGIANVMRTGALR
jgi:uncharacterized membrane protein YeaQ/YmgE (transglycosylase-associated protein family)